MHLTESVFIHLVLSVYIRLVWCVPFLRTESGSSVLAISNNSDRQFLSEIHYVEFGTTGAPQPPPIFSPHPLLLSLSLPLTEMSGSQRQAETMIKDHCLQRHPSDN